MSRLVLILAKSGTGKSTSVRNFKKDEAQAILCSGKELPIRTDIKTYVPKSYADLYTAIARASAPVVIVDDLNYMASFEEMARANEVGYQKFTQMAVNLYNVFKSIMEKESNQVYYVMAHSADNGEGDNQLKFKTTGKMLSDKIVLEGLTNIVIGADVSDGEFVFKVKTDGTGIKTPIGMFSTPTVENDLKLINDTIINYYGGAK